MCKITNGTNHSQKTPSHLNCLCTAALPVASDSISVTFCGMRWRINEIAMAVVLRIDRRLSVAVVNNL